MIVVAEFAYDDFVDAEAGRLFTQLMWEAEISHDPDERDHGAWLRQKLKDKIAKHIGRVH
jgi:hypothetical protein